MSDTYDFDMVYALNSYLFKVLEANLGWDVNDYGGRPPIIPANQETEFTQFNKPFIVFGSAIQQATVPYYKTEVVAYTIFGATATEANNIMRTVADAFEGMDLSAQMVNKWIYKEGQTRAGGPRAVFFHNIVVSSATSAGPENQEGGRSDSQVMLTVLYHTHSSTITDPDDFLA